MGLGKKIKQNPVTNKWMKIVIIDRYSSQIKPDTRGYFRKNGKDCKVSEKNLVESYSLGFTKNSFIFRQSFMFGDLINCGNWIFENYALVRTIFDTS